jgi:hypothetical protein
MRHFAFLCGAVLVFACSAGAQLGSTNSLFLGSPSPAPTAAAAALPGDRMAIASPDDPQGVYGVFIDFNFQAYVGYTYLRFYEVPNLTDNMNGASFSVVYYPHAGWFGPDGEVIAAFGSSQSGTTSKFASAMGGLRLRHAGPRGTEVWVHGLAGGAHFLPQTAYGSTNALSYELGGGIDVMPRHRRLGVRVEADVLGTNFFGTYQYSPKISAGIVYKF